jgi:TMEM9
VPRETGVTLASDDVQVQSSSGVISRMKREVRRVHGEAQKWKGTVQEQRKNIYDRHTMLN